MDLAPSDRDPVRAEEGDDQDMAVFARDIDTVGAARRWLAAFLRGRPLTEAQRRVVYLIADGHTDRSAAKALGISVNTVGTHIRAAYTKLGVQSRVQLTNVLRERGDLE